MKPGIHFDIAAADYHLDLAPEPSLSSSIARVLLEQSPWHAHAQHPRLGGTYDDKPSREKEIGTAAHKLLLGRGAEIEVLIAGDYKKKATQELREDCCTRGLSPILHPDFEAVKHMVEAAKDQLLGYPELQPLVDTKGKSEAVIVWQEGPAWCRGMVDWLHQDIRADYKTTSSSAHPQAVGTRLFGLGADVQDRFYHRGLAALGRRTERSLFIVQENEAPFGLSVVELDGQAQELGDEKVMVAIDLWQRCIASGVWPGYEQRVAVAETPAWHVNNWNNRTLAIAALQQAEASHFLNQVFA